MIWILEMQIIGQLVPKRLDSLLLKLKYAFLMTGDHVGILCCVQSLANFFLHRTVQECPGTDFIN